MSRWFNIADILLNCLIQSFEDGFSVASSSSSNIFSLDLCIILPKCFDVWIVENFLIAGHEFYIVAVGNRNNNTISWIFVKVAG